MTGISGTIDGNEITRPLVSVVNSSTDPTKIRLSGLPLRIYDNPETITDFAYEVSGWVSGTPKVEITGTGKDRRVTIELDAPKGLGGNFGSIGTPSNVKFIGRRFFTESTETYYLELATGTRNIFYIFVDKDVTVNGLIDWLSINNLKLKKGWNFLVFNDVFDENGEHYANATAAYQTLPPGTYCYVSKW